MMWSLCLCVGLLLGGGNVLGAQECGYASASGQAFVINGQNATAAESPWHAGVYVKGEHVCGGSLVHPRLVVTAAHCLYSNKYHGNLFDPKNVTVSIGSSFREWSDEPSEQIQHRNVSKLVPHPWYRGLRRYFADDIAVLILETPITVSANVLPVCMKWKDSEVPTLTPKMTGKVVGWGRPRLGSTEASPVLQSAELPFIPFEQCLKDVPSHFLPYLTQDKFCAGYIGGSSVAMGDSGGGLMFSHGGLWFLMGVVSVGLPDRLTYSGFTNVTAYSEWIGSVLETLEKPQPQPHPSPTFAPAVDNAVRFTLENRCSYTVWPATLTGGGAADGFELRPGQSMAVDREPGWSGRFWGRSNCRFDAAGSGRCETGDCSGGLKCIGGGVRPATLVEFTLGRDGLQDFYDVSLVDGFNLPLSVRAQGGSGSCREAACLNNVNNVCPEELKVFGTGGVVACQSACTKWDKPEHCCTGVHDKPATCPPAHDSMRLFKEQCPAAYSYAYDDGRGLFTCTNANNYLITFCG